MQATRRLDSCSLGLQGRAVAPALMQPRVRGCLGRWAFAGTDAGSAWRQVSAERAASSKQSGQPSNRHLGAGGAHVAQALYARVHPGRLALRRPAGKEKCWKARRALYARMRPGRPHITTPGWKDKMLEKRVEAWPACPVRPAVCARAPRRAPHTPQRAGPRMHKHSRLRGRAELTRHYGRLARHHHLRPGQHRPRRSTGAGVGSLRTSGMGGAPHATSGGGTSGMVHGTRRCLA